MTNTWKTPFCSLKNYHASTEPHFEFRLSDNIWCGVVGSQVIGPFVLEGRFTSERYLNFLERGMPVLLEGVPLHIGRELWLQQDCAHLHFGRQKHVFLNEHFRNRRTGRQGPTAWPPRSPDLTPLDYNLWGTMKSLVYAVKSSTKAEL